MSVELFRRLWEERAEELDKLWHTLERLRDVVTRLDPEAQVYVFGSFARGTARPDSDVDVLVVTELASTEEGRLAVRRALGEVLSPHSPVELHVASTEQFKWYLQFMDVFVEV
ncbi:MAG: nucleotidyltransferase domain-containing protein [Pyrobaculum sp.]|uniref:nucleotidyltransferase domain-containing protein n=1 Tax=Pyrobaculum sp. TaxID=2004705 RepID=UPI003162BCE8